MAANARRPAGQRYDWDATAQHCTALVEETKPLPTHQPTNLPTHQPPMLTTLRDRSRPSELLSAAVVLAVLALAFLLGQRASMRWSELLW